MKNTRTESGHTKQKRSKWRVSIIFLIVIALLCVGGYLILQAIQAGKYSSANLSTVQPYAQPYGLDPLLMASVVTVESDFDPNAVSSAGAIGLMQIMPETGEWLSTKLGLENYTKSMLYDPDINLRMGAWYLDFLLDRYNGDQTTALCAYNAGQGNVDSWLKDAENSSDGQTLDSIPVRDAKDYVEKVERAYALYENQPHTQ